MAFLWVERLVLSCLGALGVELYLILRLERRGAFLKAKAKAKAPVGCVAAKGSIEDYTHAGLNDGVGWQGLLGL